MFVSEEIERAQFNEASWRRLLKKISGSDAASQRSHVIAARRRYLPKRNYFRQSLRQSRHTRASTFSLCDLQGRLRECSVERGFDTGDGLVFSQAVLLAQIIDAGRVFDKSIRPSDANNGRKNAPVAEKFHHRAAVAAHENMIF